MIQEAGTPKESLGLVTTSASKDIVSSKREATILSRWLLDDMFKHLARYMVALLLWRFFLPLKPSTTRSERFLSKAIVQQIR